MRKMSAEQKKAMDAGLHGFSTGKPCIYGHMSERLTSNGRCIECRNIYFAKRRSAAFEKMDARLIETRTRLDRKEIVPGARVFLDGKLVIVGGK